MNVARLRVLLALTKRKPDFFLALCAAIYAKLLENLALFPNPNPALPLLLAQIAAAKDAQQLVRNGNKGAVPARTEAFRTLGTSMENLRMMVQTLCDATPGQAESLIASAGMKVMAPVVRHKALLAAKNGMPSGTVLLVANGRLLSPTQRNKTVNWSFSLDGGKTWISAPSTPRVKTSIAGFTPLTTVGFRVCVTIGDNPQQPWSETVTLVIR